jgi:hypothetical protein
VPEGQIFGYPWPMRLKKVNPNNHLRRCPGMSSCMEYQLGPACALEGLFEALLRFLSVALYPAVAASERISFRQINKKTGNRLRHQLANDPDRGIHLHACAALFTAVSRRLVPIRAPSRSRSYM